MKTKALLPLVLFALLPLQHLLGQTNACVLNGALDTHRLVCALPASAVVLAAGTFGPDATNPAYLTTLPINAAIAAQLTQLPVPSATIGSVSIRKKAGEVPARWDNLGPILTDRPDTVGKGHIFVGFNYQHFAFNSLDGVHLGNLPIAFTYTTASDLTSHYGSMLNKVNFKLDQYLIIATAGVTPQTDISVIVPINSVSVHVLSSNFTAYDYNIQSNTYTFRTIASNQTATKGTSNGIGDISIGVKQMLLGQNHTRPAAAVGAQFRFPSGDSYNYLGSGAYGGSILGLVEYRAKFAPHFKIAYQWNGNSKVLNIVQGNTSLLPGEAPPPTTLPGGLQYAAGTDFSALRNLTLNVDFLGSQFVNTPYFTQTTNTFVPPPTSTSGVPPTYNLVITPPKTYTTVNFSGGVKWLAWRHLLLYGNALVQLNSVGLKANVSPLGGIAYNFNLSRGD